MADLFFYGTLCHLPLLEQVLGRPRQQMSVHPARLPDHASFWVKGQNFPMISEHPGSSVDGLLVRGLSEADVAALNYYEGGFLYDLKPVSVRLGSGEVASAEVYFPNPDQWLEGAPWDLEDWVAQWGAIVTEAAKEIMAYQGRVAAETVANRAYPILVRAAAQLEARKRPVAAGRDLTKDVIVRQHDYAHLGFFGMQEIDLQHRRFDGSMGPVINRSALMVGAAAVVLPYDPARDAVLLVQQFRTPTFLAGEPDPWIWEPVAGLIDPGETPESTARREAVEEAGVEISHLEPVAAGYPSTGNSGEYIHIFIGLADLSHVTGGGGVASEGEDIRSRVISFDDLMAGIDAQTFNDMPLITAGLWLARHRNRLQNDFGRGV